MRRLNRFTGLAMALLFTFLVACSQPAEEITFPDTEISSEEVYLETIRTEYPELSQVSDESLVTVAESTCSLLDSGATLDDLISITVSSGVPPEMGGYITGAGISMYCPEYLDLIK